LLRLLGAVGNLVARLAHVSFGRVVGRSLAAPLQYGHRFLTTAVRAGLLLLLILLLLILLLLILLLLLGRLGLLALALGLTLALASGAGSVLVPVVGPGVLLRPRIPRAALGVGATAEIEYCRGRNVLLSAQIRTPAPPNAGKSALRTH
jgi:hypothetical protein